MSIAWTLLYVIACGLAIGAGGRWLVPGPDPMPAWLTSAIGIAGSAIGTGAVLALAGVPETAGDAYSLVWSAIGASLAASALLVVVYRRTVQGRPIRGREAWRMPTRGIGQQRGRGPPVCQTRRPRRWGQDGLGKHPPGPPPPAVTGGYTAMRPDTGLLLACVPHKLGI